MAGLIDIHVSQMSSLPLRMAHPGCWVNVSNAFHHSFHDITAPNVKDNIQIHWSWISAVQVDS